MRRVITFLMVFVLAMSLTGCHGERIKKGIFELVETNYDVILEACEAGDVEALSNIDGIEQVDIVDGYVLVYCKGRGIAPASQDFGFYYSEENLPAVVFDGKIICDTSGLVSHDKGFQYIDEGYNTFYTENIKENIYFYSASF